MNIHIRKIKIKNDLPSITYERTEDDGKKTTVEECGPYLVHGDFRDAMNALAPHLAKICDLRESDVIGEDIGDCDMENFSCFVISGITVSGDDDQEGCCIVGQKRIGQKVLNLVTPFQKFEDEYDGYPFKEELREAVINTEREAVLYMEGKHATGQMEMEFEEHGEDLD